MHNRFTVTITELSGSRHYELHFVVKKLIRYALIALVLILISTISAILYLDRNVMELEEKKDVIASRLSFLLEENGNLSNQINTKLKEFSELNHKIDFIQEIIGMEANPDMSLNERVELASMRISRREKEFREIGNKIESIEGLIGLDGKKTPSLMKRVDLAKITAAQKKAMLDNIPSGYPVPQKGITGKFGPRNHPILKRKEFHAGVDLRAKMKTKVRATADGVVEYSGVHKKSGFGRLLIIRHNFGFRTSFGHLNELLVKNGEYVKKGEVVALSGNSGLSSGPHLHYEVRHIHSSLDPETFMKWKLENYEVVFQETRIKWPSLIKLINHRLTPPTPQSLQVAQK